MKIKEFLMPTVSKMILYAVFFFISPTVFRICDSSGCDYSFQLLVGFKLIQQSAPPMTISTIVILFLISYIISCLIVSGFNYLKEKRMTLS